MDAIINAAASPATVADARRAIARAEATNRRPTAFHLAVVAAAEAADRPRQERLARLRARYGRR